MRVFFVAVLLAWPASAYAYRPFTGTDADVAGLGEVELEIGAFGWLHAGHRDALVAPGLIANYGFLPRCELVLEGREFVLTDVAPGESRVQLLDTQLDVKTVLREGALQDKSGPSIAIEATVLLPETGNTTPGAEVAAIVSQRWDALTVHWNGSAAYSREGNLALFGGAILEGPHAWTVRPVAEGFVEWEDGGATEVSGLGGAIWRLSENLSLDAAARISHLDDAGVTTSAWEARVGLTWAFSAITRQPEKPEGT